MMNMVLVYLPPYSPDLNPIEQIWRAIKRVLSPLFIKTLEELKEVFSNSNAEACDILLQKDFKNVYNMLGGLKAWQREGFPVTPSTSTGGFEIFFIFAALYCFLSISRNKNKV
ncbi:MAG: rhodanese-like domain-containing protein [Candidatus Methanospirareceae archaeon]